MKKIAPRLRPLVLFSAGLLPFVLSCNVYKPFSSPGNDEEYREAALACLHSADYSCAVDNYNKLSDAGERDSDLCTVEMAQAGMTLEALVNVVSEKTTGAKLFGSLANRFLPYSTDKMTAASDARTRCAALPTTGSRGKLNLLLLTLSYFVDCSTRMAGTTVRQCSSSTVTVAGTGHSTVSATDISPDTTGTFTGDAMCDDDANQCALDFYNAFNTLSQLQNNGYDQIANNMTAINSVFNPLFGSSQPALSAAGGILARQFIRQTTSN